jgi:hypothetical protein
MTRSHAIALGAVVVLVVSALALPRRSALVSAPDPKPDAHDSTAQSIEATPAAPAPEVEPPAAPVAQPEAASPVVVESMKKSPAKPIQKVAAASTRSPIATPVAQTRDKDTSEREDIMAPTGPVPAPARPVPATASVDQITITGCLEASATGDRFRLTDTEGANAPKARSWRTGFLKKHSTAVDLVGAPDVALQRQIGRRVAVSGVQTDRELKVSAVRVVSPSCN